MLNFFTTSNGFRSTLPVVSNLTAMNVWDGVCMGFIYASLLEFVCVNYNGRKRPLHNVVYRPGENPVTQVVYLFAKSLSIYNKFYALYYKSRCHIYFVMFVKHSLGLFKKKTNSFHSFVFLKLKCAKKYKNKIKTLFIYTSIQKTKGKQNCLNSKYRLSAYICKLKASSK